MPRAIRQMMSQPPASRGPSLPACHLTPSCPAPSCHERLHSIPGVHYHAPRRTLLHGAAAHKAPLRAPASDCDALSDALSRLCLHCQDNLLHLSTPPQPSPPQPGPAHRWRCAPVGTVASRPHRCRRRRRLRRRGRRGRWQRHSVESGEGGDGERGGVEGEEGTAMVRTGYNVQMPWCPWPPAAACAEFAPVRHPVARSARRRTRRMPRPPARQAIRRATRQESGRPGLDPRVLQKRRKSAMGAIYQ